MTLTKAATALALACSFALTLHAQSTDCSTLPNRMELANCVRAHTQSKVIQLTNVTSQNQANEILVALRNTFDPSDKMFLIANRNEIVVSSYPQEIARIEALAHELDTPHKTYRLTYTFTDTDSGKRIGVQRYSLLAIPGNLAVLKAGDKVPVATGSFSASGAATSTHSLGTKTQFTYLDVGINLDATLNPAEQGEDLVYRIDQSSLSNKPSGVGAQDPVVHQTSLTGDAILTPDKPAQLGTVDVPGTSRHVDIAVTLEPAQ